MARQVNAELGLFGGSGFYSFLDGATDVAVHTPYGPPSDRVAVGEVAGRRIAFLPRHGRNHTIPPHRINYRANLWAMRELGVTRILAPCAVGSLRRDIAPGTFVVCDQIVDRTSGRADTFYDGPVVTHVGFADPYCPELRSLAAACGTDLGIAIREAGTGVVIQGPRFSTRAESAFYAAQGWDVIGMTQYPEVVLARELELCCVNISLVTDYDVGIEDIPAVTTQEVVRILQRNNDALRSFLGALIPRIPLQRSCPCGSALADAQL
ncbi:MAG: 5-methylthioadenosine phosphorylase [Actinomycetota bacterium]|nr:5-methylthioadenosine phosphorylase [Actinomycetota bacterium]